MANVLVPESDIYHIHDLIPAVSWHRPGEVEVERLLLNGSADLITGRHSLLTCAECGDNRCGCVSAVIERDSTDYVWHTFGYESNDLDFPEPDFEPFLGKGPYRFNSEQYERVLREMNRIGVRS